MKYHSIHAFSKLIGKTPQTLRNWDKRGFLKPHHVTTSGYRYYSQEQLEQFFGFLPAKSKLVIGYCRVSSSKQKDDLNRQIEAMQTYLLTKGEPFKIITDIGSGINYNKKGLLNLLELINGSEVSKVVVLYKDRLVRFGFELIEQLASLHECTIEVIDTTERTHEQELVEDLVQIITVFSYRLQGRRANKAREMIRELVALDA